jgi:hypothetical protein
MAFVLGHNQYTAASRQEDVQRAGTASPLGAAAATALR